MTGFSPLPSPSDTSFFNHVLAALDIVVLEWEVESGALRLQGYAPKWWQELPAASGAAVPDLNRWSPFLPEFLAYAQEVWKDEPDRTVTSGSWTEPDQTNGTVTLEAKAVSLGLRKLLLIERLGSDFENMRSIVQRAREQMLAEEVSVKSYRSTQSRLIGQLEASERTKDDAVALLQHLGLAAMVLDECGEITFVTDRTHELLGMAPHETHGRHWDQVLSVRKEDRPLIHHLLESSTQTRAGKPLCLEGGRPRWIELEIHRDLRYPTRRILVINDRTELHALRQALNEQSSFHDLVGKSQAMLRVYQLVRDVAQVDTTVLIEGETGTGKELIARAIHASSARKNKPFIAANCAGLTDSILTSQLFGHRRGAFTGAIQDQQGLFEAAEGGTLFLDEIGDIPAQVQTALLRVLQEKEITRLGEAKPRPVNVRVVAATHHNLSEDVLRGSFRADLLYRIRVARVQLSPLRDRREDIPLLAQSLLGQICASTGKLVERLHPDTLRLLMSHSWPGNVRELKSAVEFAVISCKGNEVCPEDLPPEIAGTSVVSSPPVFIPLSNQDEKTRLLVALSEAKGNRTEAAKRLGISRATFYRRLVELEIHPR